MMSSRLSQILRSASRAKVALGLALGLGILWSPLASAEKADRSKNWVIEGDRDATLDEQRRTVVILGNASITQGSMALRSDRIEIQELSGGARNAVALGSAAKPATFRQKRDVPNEHVEAQAERIEYEGATDTVRFVGKAVLRIVRGTTTVHEVSGALLSWDNRSEQFSAKGSSPSASSPGGRFQWIMTPASAPAGDRK